MLVCFAVMLKAIRLRYHWSVDLSVMLGRYNIADDQKLDNTIMSIN